MKPLQRLLVALYWEARPASPQAAATELLPAFEALREAGLSKFFLKARSRRRAESQPFTPGAAEVAAQLGKGVNRRDVDRSVIPELGYSMGLWSGGSDEECFALSVHIGSVSPHARNNFLLDLPALGPYALHREPERVRALFFSLVAILSPSQGIVCAPDAIRWEGSVLSLHAPSLATYANAA
jgi:hypothetical protein